MRRALIAVAVLGTACALIDPCDNGSLKEFKSQSGKWKVVVFERSCGATTDFSTQVSVLPTDSSLPRKPGNALIIDSNHGAVAVDRNGLIDVRVTFTSDASLTLEYSAQARVFLQATNIDGVLIQHRR